MSISHFPRDTQPTGDGGRGHSLVSRSETLTVCATPLQNQGHAAGYLRSPARGPGHSGKRPTLRAVSQEPWQRGLLEAPSSSLLLEPSGPLRRQPLPLYPPSGATLHSLRLHHAEVLIASHLCSCCPLTQKPSLSCAWQMPPHPLDSHFFHSRPHCVPPLAATILKLLPTQHPYPSPKSHPCV